MYLRVFFRFGALDRHDWRHILCEKSSVKVQLPVSHRADKKETQLPPFDQHAWGAFKAGATRSSRGSHVQREVHAKAVPCSQMSQADTDAHTCTHMPSCMCAPFSAGKPLTWTSFLHVHTNPVCARHSSTCTLFLHTSLSTWTCATVTVDHTGGLF